MNDFWYYENNLYYLLSVSYFGQTIIELLHLSDRDYITPLII